VEAGLEVEYARDSIGFHWAGCEEGDEVAGEGTASPERVESASFTIPRIARSG
jgi:hypothetical protein